MKMVHVICWPRCILWHPFGHRNSYLIVQMACVYRVILSTVSLLNGISSFHFYLTLIFAYTHYAMYVSQSIKKGVITAVVSYRIFTRLLHVYGKTETGHLRWHLAMETLSRSWHNTVFIRNPVNQVRLATALLMDENDYFVCFVIPVECNDENSNAV